jgi:hypothetical protein
MILCSDAVLHSASAVVSGAGATAEASDGDSQIIGLVGETPITREAQKLEEVHIVGTPQHCLLSRRAPHHSCNVAQVIDAICPTSIGVAYWIGQLT